MVKTFFAKRELSLVGKHLTNEQYGALKRAIDAVDSPHTTLATIAHHDAALDDLRVKEQCKTLLGVTRRLVAARRAQLREADAAKVRVFWKLEQRGRLVA